MEILRGGSCGLIVENGTIRPSVELIMNHPFMQQAAVLLAVSDKPEGEEEILLTLRASHLSSHSGEVAFPGGKWEPGDPSLRYTALREANEEVGLIPDTVEVVAELSPSYTRAGMRVTPYIGRVPAASQLTPNLDELTEIFWLPLTVLKADLRVRTDVFEYRGQEYWAPVYEYAGFTVWGFTARVLVDFMQHFYGVRLERSHPSAPEVVYGGISKG